VYKHNVDIYSVLLTYVYFINNNKIPKKYVSELKEICYRYMYSQEIAVTKIDVNKLTEELDNLFGKPANIETKAVAKTEGSPVSSRTRSKTQKAKEEKKIAGPSPVQGIQQAGPSPIERNSIKRAGPTPNVVANQPLAIFDDYFGGKKKKKKTRKTRKHKRKTR